MTALLSLPSFHLDVDALVPRLGWTLIHSLWEGAVVATLLTVLLHTLRSASAPIRYLASCAAMAMLAISFVATFLLLAPAPFHEHHDEMQLPAQPFVARQVPVQFTPLIAVHPIASVPTAASPQRDGRMRYLVTAWTAGVAAIALWHIAGWFWLWLISRGRTITPAEPMWSQLRRQLRIHRAVRLIECARLDIPAVVGVFRPIILVPIGMFNDLSPQQVEAILAHELAHITRHDYLANLIQAAVETLLFYHPAVWWISAQIRRERENCCDDIAAGCGDARAYAAALLALEQRRSPIGLPLAAATGGNLLERVQRLLHRAPATRRRPVRSLIAAIIALACVGIPLAAVAEQRRAVATTKPDVAPAPSATDATAAADASPVLPEDLKPSTEEYRVAPADALVVSINDLLGEGKGDTVKICPISEPDGTIDLPFVGQLKVAGMTQAQCQKAIVKAYHDGQLLQNPQVSVSVDAKGRAYDVLGKLDKPGRFAIAKSDLRLSTALAEAGAHPEEIGDIRVLRAAVNGGHRRVLTVPSARLFAGDSDVDIVIRPGDTVVVEEREHQFVKIVIGKNGLMYQDKPIDLQAIRAMCEQMPKAQRHSTVLEIAAASPDITVERFFNASGQLSEVVKDYGLAYLSQTGIQPTTETAAINSVGTGEQGSETGTFSVRNAEAGEYYMGGNVKRVGVYSLTGRKITLKQAIVAAGGFDQETPDAFISVLRRSDGKENYVMKNALYGDLLSGKQRDLYLHANDVVMVHFQPLAVQEGTTQEAPMP